MPQVTPFLWFEDKAEEAAKYYVSVFPNSSVTATVLYPEAAEEVSGRPKGSVMTVEFDLDGQKFSALNGGNIPGFNFTSAISFVVMCKDQAEIDHYWSALSAVPEAEQCGWCKDQFGITWQVVPEILGTLLSSPDQAQVERVTACFMPMKKFDIAALEAAAK